VARPGGPPPAPADPSIALPAAFESIRMLGGGSCLVSKRIANNLRIPLLHEIFPRARFVFLIRDGRAVARSLAGVDWWETNHIWWYGGTPTEWRAEGKDPWDLCAEHWVREADAIEDGLESIPDDQQLRLRYEDLVRDPSSNLGEVARFLGLPESPPWRAALETLPIEDRTSAFPDDAVVARINSIQQRTLERYGYVA
jgi:omega-hydroxy-beta-dihydromenaquinone-9 sulfotransferase